MTQWIPAEAVAVSLTINDVDGNPVHVDLTDEAHMRWWRALLPTGGAEAMTDIAAMHSRNVAEVNARLAAEGRCVLHNTGVDHPAVVIIGLPIGNELPLCVECWTWWQGTLTDLGAADPNNVPDWVRYC